MVARNVSVRVDIFWLEYTRDAASGAAYRLATRNGRPPSRDSLARSQFSRSLAAEANAVGYADAVVGVAGKAQAGQSCDATR